MLTKKEKSIQDAYLNDEFPGLHRFKDKQPLIRPYARDVWILEEDYRFNFKFWMPKRPGRGKVLVKINWTAKKGMIFDAASVPSSLKSLTNGSDAPEHIAASLFHDKAYLYGFVDQRTADFAFRYLLKRNQTEKRYARRMFVGVRIGGGVTYGQHERRRNKLKKDGKI